jgi:hypothetical protein
MRLNLNTVLLLAGVALLALDLASRVGNDRPLPLAFGQGGEDADLLMAAANTQNEVYCFLYSKKTRQLISYVPRGTGCIELKGIRKCEWDFNPKIDEFPDCDGPTAVKKMKALKTK